MCLSGQCYHFIYVMLGDVPFKLVMLDFYKQEYDAEDSVLPVQPSLNYAAPELVRNKAPAAGYSSDIFTLGCLAYHLIASKPLLDCHNNIKMVCIIDYYLDF